MPDAHSATAVADVLTPLARSILEARGDAAYAQLVVHGAGSEDGMRLLKGVRPEQLLTRPIKNAEASSALLAALWLWHDWLAESHAISQSLVTATGSFWHAIMHRREGDFSNAKYWYARCQTHPAMRTIAVGASPILGSPGLRATQGVGRNGWDPYSYVDWVEEIYEHPDDPTYAAAVELQRLEWRTLFAECAFAAAGAGTMLGGGIE